MRSFQSACVGSQTSMPMPSDQERAVLSFSAVAPGPTSSFTRQRSAAAVTGWGGAKGALDAVIAGQRIGQRRRQMAAGGQQQRRRDDRSSRDRHRFTSLLV